mgnify:CR=1 FL=1
MLSCCIPNHVFLQLFIMMMKNTGRISSTRNKKILEILRLEKRREREEQGLFLVEGYKEAQMAFQASYVVRSIFYCPDILPPRKIKELVQVKNYSGDIFEVTPEVYARIAYRENSEGICLLAETRYVSFRQLVLPSNPLLLVIESVEKPGNIGAILRTADAAGVHAVIVCDPRTDIYNPNVVRASRGCLFTVPVVVSTVKETLSFLREKAIRTFAAALPAGKYYYEADFTKSSAIIMGTESEGLSDFWLQNANELIKIPMTGQADSLNVSISAAIIVYEAMRQRGFH